MSPRFKKIIIFFGVLLLIVGFLVFLKYVSPEALVLKLGVQNGYLLIFFTALLGGLSASGSIIFITLLVTLVAGGLNPLYAGLLTGAGLIIGDLLMFYIGSHGRALVTGKVDQYITNFASHIKEKRSLQILAPILGYFYIGFAPLPNEFPVLFFAVIKYPVKRVFTIIILGDITFALMVAYLGSTLY